MFSGVSTKSEQMAPMTAVIGGTAGGAVFAVLLVILAVILIKLVLTNFFKGEGYISFFWILCNRSYVDKWFVYWHKLKILKKIWIRRKRKEKNQGRPAVDLNMNAQYANGLSASNYKPHSVAFRRFYLL